MLSVNNGQVQSAHGGVQAQKVDTKNTLYVGGYPRTHNGGQRLRGVETDEQFVGCIRDLQISRRSKGPEDKIIPSLSASQASGDVIAGACPLD